MLRVFTVIAFAALCLGASSTEAKADDVVYLSNEKVMAKMSDPGVMTEGSDHIVIMSRRDKGGQSEVHAGETDVFYVIEGSATFVTGGTVVDAKTTGPGQIRGSGIKGGKKQMLSKGDVIVIPKGTPHWFKDVPKLVVYYVVKAK